MTLTPLAMATLFCSWGPGPLLYRCLLLIAVVVSCSLISSLTIATVDTLRHDLDFYVDFVNTVQVVAVIAIPLMLLLSVFAALARWRIGPHTMNAIRIRIYDVMLATMAIAIQLAISSRMGMSYVLTVSAVVAPIAAVGVTISAWSLCNRYAFALNLIIVLAAFGLLSTRHMPSHIAAESYAMLGAAIVASSFIAINVWLLSKAGWPLSRRLPSHRLADDNQTMVQMLAS
ncbi:MAG: hypothetical protein AAGG48_11835 [Planctomycetota bacterium]